MVPTTGHVITAHVDDTSEQRHQIQPQALSSFNATAAWRTPIPKDLGMATSTVQMPSQALNSLASPFFQSHPSKGFEPTTTAQTDTLRDYEKHLNDLKKENFSLKLRIYFLEERMQQKYEASREDVYRKNIELKVEVESLKQDLHEKQQSLDEAWAAAENVNCQNKAEICHQQQNKHELQEKKIRMLQEEAHFAKTETERMTALAEAEKKRCLELTKQLLEFSKKQDETKESQALLETYYITLAEKDKRIEELTQSLNNKEQHLERLSTEKRNLLQCLEESHEMEVQNVCEDPQQSTPRDSSPGKQAPELCNAELMGKIDHLDATNKLLQEKLNELNFELKSGQQTCQRQEHKIQNLTEALKSKESESEELYRVIEGQNEAMARLRDMVHRSQLGQLQLPERCPSSQQSQPKGLLELQNTVFFMQLEVQQLKRAEQQKDRQLAETRRSSQLFEEDLQAEQQQKEATWEHNRELRATLRQLQTELRNKTWQCQTLEMRKFSEMQRAEQKMKHLSRDLAYKDQLLQEAKELLQYHQSLNKSTTLADNMVQKLQQRIKDRDAALERVVDEKFCMLEEREQELQQFRLTLRDRERDLEQLQGVLSANKATIQSLESLLKAKSLELEQLSATCQNLQWLKGEVEAKSQNWQAEHDGIIQQLQTALHDRNKEVEALSAALLCKMEPGQRDTVEELCCRLQQKERIIQVLLSDKSRQALKQESELWELLQAVSAREQQSRLSSEKMAQALTERSCELQFLHQQLASQSPGQKTEPSPVLMQGSPGESTTATVSKRGDDKSKMETGVLELATGLEKELITAKEELQVLVRKERESRLELSALQSVVSSQEEELQVQASDVESLTRNIQIKEELIKDLQMQLVDPEEMPAMEQLTQEVLMLREKVARVELQGQEASGSNRKQQLLLVLEELAAEKNRLNEALQAEKQLYSTLVKFHTQPDSYERGQSLQVELEEVQALRGQLEEALGRSLEHLNRLDSLDAIGAPPPCLHSVNSMDTLKKQIPQRPTVAEDGEDASTEFTDSIEEEAAAHRVAQQQNVKAEADEHLGDPSGNSAPPSSVSERNLHEEVLCARAESQQVWEQKKKLEEELQDLKGQIEEAGFSSVSHLRKALLSLCLENAELKEQVGEATLSEGWEEDEKEDGENLRLEVRKLREKQHTSEIVIGLLKEQLILNSPGGDCTIKPQCAASTALETERLQLAKRHPSQRPLHENAPQWHCPQPEGGESSPSHNSTGAQVGGNSLTSDYQQPFMESVPQICSQLTQCRQQCQELHNKLLDSKATVQAQAAQLEQYRALLIEYHPISGKPIVQQASKQIQVDLQDLGYETCGRSENEADREEVTSPECEEHDLFNEEPKSWEKLLGSHPSQLANPEIRLDYSQCDDAAVLRQHIQDLHTHLKSSNRAIQNLQNRVRSLSSTSDYASGTEHLPKLKKDYAMGSSPSHSMTDEDEGWHSDSLGSLCPPSLQPKKDLAKLIQRVSLLEAHMGEAKPELPVPEELKPTASIGKYDSLVQAQARELSHMRQMMEEGRGMCHMLNQHYRDIIKSFEELLRGTDIDYFLGQNFREQLTQGKQLTGRLARKLSSSQTSLSVGEKSRHELLTLRLSKELQEKDQLIGRLQAKLRAHSMTPSSSRTMSESPRTGSSASFLSDGLEGCSDMDEVSEDAQDPVDPREGQRPKRLDPVSAPQTHLPPPATASCAVPAESIRRDLALPSTQQQSQVTSQTSTGCHSNSLPKPGSFPLAPLASGSCTFQPLGPPPPAPSPFLGCCRAPIFSLAKAQQELQTLQKQLGESGRLSALSPSKPVSLAGPCPSGKHGISSKHCLPQCQQVPQLFPMHNPTAAGGHMGMPHFRHPQKGLTCGSLLSCSSAHVSSQKLSGADLLEENLAEIRILRQRLEESICTNDRLRQQLETRLASVAKSDELEHLKEALLVSHSKLQDGESELQRQWVEQQHLRHEIWGKQQDFLKLQEECLALQKNNSRLQRRVELLQQQCTENQLLFQAMQAELRFYEVLCGLEQREASVCHQSGQLKGSPTSGVGDLLPEVKALRNQLAHAVQVNCVLRQQLEQQLSTGAGAALRGIGASDSIHGHQNLQESSLSPPVRDVGINSSASLSSLTPSSPPVFQTSHGSQGTHAVADLRQRDNVPSRAFADKQGAHVIGPFKNYSALKQQIFEGQSLIHQMASLLQPGLEPQSGKAFCGGSNRQLLANASSLQLILEKSAALLAMFWRAVLPTPDSSAQVQQAEQSEKDEIQALRAKLAEQESRLQNASHLKETMENFVLTHLTRTHAVLRKARTNLEGMSQWATSVSPVL